MSEDTYRQDYGAWLFGGYAELGSTGGVEGGGNAQKTNSKGGYYGDRAANDSYANCPRAYKEAGYIQASSRSSGDAGSHGTYNDLSKPSSSRYTPYEITSRGINDQDNKYDTRVQQGGPGHHYSNQDGSYYYKNGDNSTYYNNGQGGATYTSPDGKVYKK
ncbi:hypothetical protein NA56DRAFT_706143 [Hyaloscypha hepaticicola]|uniref:Uncharacterized protein n=1 Tax=Hyaloscypha hepaticicola TaxID=2082293 RepID=A0A2J6PYJ9_9HELO|nr:hypothetical protein NA56DRAFT_706143 [Hyaloscypha hepaticicola]